MFATRRHLVVLVAAASLGISACATPQAKTSCPPCEQQQTAPKAAQPGPAANENLNATLWQQTSAEYQAVALQTYRAAADKLDDALADKTWVAAVEQTAAEAKGKPPAIILDVDETVLDNSAYQARLIKSGETYDTATWNAWCDEAQAGAVPGALALTKKAADKGVTVFYVTNRDHSVEEATRQNLAKLGFPLADDTDTILTKHEKEGWGSDKTPRRELVAKNYRIVMLFGDNLGDFVAKSAAQGAPQARVDAAMNYEKRWGTSWFMLPNPMYGYWESAPYDYDYGISAEQKGQKKLDALDTAR